MRKLKLVIHSILLATTSTFFAHPQNNLPRVNSQVVNDHSDQGQRQEGSCPLTYDEILSFLEKIESGELEERCSFEQLEKVNQFIALLAKEGELPDVFGEEIVLEEDIEDLLYGQENPFEYAFASGNYEEYMIVPAAFNGYSNYDAIQCGWVSESWKKTKKFVKNHKKEIIIGAVVVVAATVIIVAVAASSTAGVVAAAAGAASSSKPGSSGLDSSGSSKSEEKGGTPSAPAIPREAFSSVMDPNEAPILRSTIDEHVFSFKEFLVEDNIVQQAAPYEGRTDLSFGEKARELGAHLAHQAYDEITELTSVVPQLCEEVKEISSKLLPESFSLHNESAIENYDNLVSIGHKAIDSVFSTDQAELFVEGARANDPMNDFAIGMIPLPGGVPKIFSNTNRLIKAGNAVDRAGFTRVGRGLMKHGNRKGSIFPKPLGNPAEMNRRGQMILEEILNDPKRTIFKNNKGGIEIYAPSGRGVYFREDGTFRGFIEYGHK